MRDTVKFIVNTERDADILAWLEDQPNKSAAFRKMARYYIAAVAGGMIDDSQEEPTMADLSQKLDELLAQMEELKLRGIGDTGNESDDEPENSEMIKKLVDFGKVG